MLDSGAKFHATSCRSHFSYYFHGDFGKVCVGNGHPCQVVGKATIQLGFPNGYHLELNEVRHTLELKRSLISVGQLGNEGYDTILSKNSLKIMKGSLVFARGENIGNMYLVPNASFIKGSCLKNGDQFHKCWDRKKQRR